MVAQTRHGGQPSPKKRLEFREKLVGKSLSTDALLKKLKTLHSQLAALDQDHVDVSSLGTARKELIHRPMLLHKDEGVRAYTACCLADILRLYAPDAPYTQAELRDIFQFFFRQLSTGLKGSDSTYYNQYFHLLESLSTVKSVVLVCDLPSSDELTTEIFRDFFILARRDLAKKVEMFMVDILVAIIDEATTLPSEVLDIIMAQFTDKNARIDQPAYRLAVQVCNGTADKLQRNVCQYFTDIIVAHSTDDDFDDIRNAHDLIKSLYRSCPSVLHSVIPQLEEELRAEDLTLRLIATQVLGEMFSDKGGADLVRKYPATWSVWLSRKNDRAVPIRLKVVESCRNLLMNLPESRESVEGLLQDKILDPDEKVRAAACKVYSQLDYEAALHHVSKAQLQAVAGRGLDKKHAVRVEALNSIGKLYSIAYPEIENNDPAAIQQFAWIPDEVLQITGTSPEIRAVVEQVLADHILPLPTPANVSGSKGGEIDEIPWTDRLLGMMRYLTDKSINALLSLSGLKSVRPNIYEVYTETCIKNNGGIIDEDEELITRRLSGTIQHLAATFPEPHKANEDLHAFAKLNESRLYKLAKTCMDPQTDLKSLVKALNEFHRRLEQLSSAILPTLTIFLRRASFRILNQSSIPPLLRRISKGHGSTAEHLIKTATQSQTLLTFISKYCPSLYKPHIAELVKAISNEKNPHLVEVALQALAGLVKWDDKLAPVDKRTNDRIERIAMQANWRQAKFAAQYLAFSKNRDDACTRLVESIADAFEGDDAAEAEDIVAHVAALAQIARYNPDAFEHRSDVIMAFLLKHILMVPILPEHKSGRASDAMDEDEEEDVEEWVADEDVSSILRAKILSLKVCRNRSLAHATSEKALEIATPVLKILATILEHNGSLKPDIKEESTAMSRMRLQAAVSLLHLSTVETYAVAMAPKFLRLAVSIQDTCFNVRIGFLTKLVSLLQPRKIPPRYNAIPFLTVHDPEMDVKNMASTYIQGAKRKMSPALRVENLELIFVRLLHLLAHHPDFYTTHDDLLDIAKYVQFYLDLIASQDNISLLFHLAMKLKTVRDVDSHLQSEKLYMMSELAQELIQMRAQVHSWTVQSYPGKIRLPSDILRPLPSAEAAKEECSFIVKTVFLPEETRQWLSGLSKTALSKDKKERKPPAKRKVTTTKSNGNGSNKRPRRKAKSHDDESDDNGASEGEGSDVDRDDGQQTSSPKANQTDTRSTRASARNLAKARGGGPAARKSSPMSEG